jgi:hypothetical protein
MKRNGLKCGSDREVVPVSVFERKYECIERTVAPGMLLSVTGLTLTITSALGIIERYQLANQNARMRGYAVVLVSG